jgi:hypothetical protein
MTSPLDVASRISVQTPDSGSLPNDLTTSFPRSNTSRPGAPGYAWRSWIPLLMHNVSSVLQGPLWARYGLVSKTGYSHECFRLACRLP